MNTWMFLRNLHEICHFMSKEKQKERATNSELKRWIQNKAFLINGESVSWNEVIDFPIFSVVLFPNSSKHRCTLL